MLTSRGIECDKCGIIADTDILNEKSEWWFFGDESGRAHVEILSFGRLNLTITVPRQFEFCSIKCARAYIEAALTLKQVTDEAARLWTHNEQEELRYDHAIV